MKGIGGEIRPGIVHRLDKETSGVIVVAKSEQMLNALQDQFRARTVKKAYRTMVWGRPERPILTIEAPISRDPKNRKRMCVLEGGRDATSHYEVVESFDTISYVRVRIDTGRTHQIRVHMSHIGHPVVGDKYYGGSRPDDVPAPVTRQMLHAANLTFTHPGTDQPLEFDVPLPEDMQNLLNALRRKDEPDSSRT
ncbi:MAG: RluA family pseudouridine synthase [Verrucomicrobiota bacterium]